MDRQVALVFCHLLFVRIYYHDELLLDSVVALFTNQQVDQESGRQTWHDRLRTGDMCYVLTRMPTLYCELGCSAVSSSRGQGSQQCHSKPGRQRVVRQLHKVTDTAREGQKCSWQRDTNYVVKSRMKSRMISDEIDSWNQGSVA